MLFRSTKATFDGAAALATVADVNSDIHASEEYRREMLKVFTKRALEQAAARS